MKYKKNGIDQKGGIMRKFVFLWGLAVSTCFMASFAYAGRVELTTYYPTANADYENVATKRLTLGVAPGNAAATPTGILTFVGQDDDPSETIPIASGSLFYDTTGDGQFKYKDNNGNWVGLSQPRLGEWSTTWNGTDLYANEGTYLAQTNGFVVAYVSYSASYGGYRLQGYAGPVAASLSLVAQAMHSTSYDLVYDAITFPVKKGHYWKVWFSNPTATLSIRWIPYN